MKTAAGIMSRKITLRENWWVESADPVCVSWPVAIFMSSFTKRGGRL
jgi:hypothetical protein